VAPYGTDPEGDCDDDALCDDLADCVHWLQAGSSSFGDNSDQRARGVAVAPNGDFIIGGDAEGVIDFGGGPLTVSEGADIVVSRFDSGGNHLWSKRFGSTSEQRLNDLAVDSSGNVILVGQFQGTFDFGGDALKSAGSDDVFVAKLSAKGEHIWSRAFGDDKEDVATAVAVTTGDHIVVAGHFVDTINFGGLNQYSNDSLTSDWFVTRLGIAGIHAWSQRLGGPDDDYVYRLATDSNDSVYVVGEFSGSMSAAMSAFVATGKDGLLVKIGPVGAVNWGRQISGAGDEVGTAIAIDDNDAVLIGASFTNDIQIGNGTKHTTTAVTAAVLSKVVSTGTESWSYAYDGATISAIDAYEGSRDVVFAGTAVVKTSFGGETLTPAGATDVFLARLKKSGAYVHSRLYGDDQLQVLGAMKVDSNKRIYLAGHFSGQIDFGHGALLTSSGGNLADIFLTRLLP